MTKKDVLEYVKQNNLLSTIGKSDAGVYAITIDGHVAYIGESSDIYERCITHFNHILNNKGRWKYKVLYVAEQELKSKVDCVLLCLEDDWTKRLGEEASRIREYRYLLNWQHYKQHQERRSESKTDNIKAITSDTENRINP